MKLGTTNGMVGSTIGATINCFIGPTKLPANRLENGARELEGAQLVCALVPCASAWAGKFVFGKYNKCCTV